jgi:hypothetical protein
MCDISFMNGKGLLGQAIKKIHEDKLINEPLKLEKFILDRDNDIPKINNDSQTNIKSNLDNKTLNNMERWLFIYNTQNNNNDDLDNNITILNNKSNVLENALKFLLNDYTKLNNEFIKNIHIADNEKINDLSQIEIYDESVNIISKKWNLILKYENIFKNLINILDENMKKTVQLNEL